MGKTWKDVKAFDIKRQKEGSRMQTIDMDLRTRTKPLVKKERRMGPKNLVRELDSFLEEEYDNDIGDEHEDF